MKNWNMPEVDELKLKETAHNWTGIYRDGGYIGDGEISGHSTWTKPTATPTPLPTEPAAPVAPATPTGTPEGSLS